LTNPAKLLRHAFELVPKWRADRDRFGHVLIALDFDGTIAPIVPHPEEAQLLPRARPVLDALAERTDTEIALISGRSLSDLRERIGIGDVYYAGNHGLELHGPDLDDTVEGALALQPRVQEMWQALQHAVGGIEGVYLENKQLSLSVHYRKVEDEREQRRVQAGVQHIFEQQGAGLRITSGKRVLEVRPDIEWHKGKALLFIIDDIERARGAHMLPLFIGDDITDEDAFAALPSHGAGVLVGSPDTPTAASSFVASPDEVIELLERLR
jgi:trehalose 6-phosphate phosphatase